MSLVTSPINSTATGGGTEVPHTVVKDEVVTVFVQARSASGTIRDIGTA